MLDLTTKRYLFLIGAFVAFIGTFVPWACYNPETERYCADGFSRELFVSSDLSLLHNGGILIIFLVLFVVWSALSPETPTADSLKTTWAATVVLLLVGIFFFTTVWQGTYQQAAPTDVFSAHIGVPLVITGALIMFSMALWEYWPQRPVRSSTRTVYEMSGDE